MPVQGPEKASTSVRQAKLIIMTLSTGRGKLLPGLKPLNILGFFDQALHPPGLGLGELAAGLDLD